MYHIAKILHKIGDLQPVNVQKIAQIWQEYVSLRLMNKQKLLKTPPMLVAPQPIMDICT